MNAVTEHSLRHGGAPHFTVGAKGLVLRQGFDRGRVGCRGNKLNKAYIHTCAHTHVNTHTRTSTRTRTYTKTNTHTHTHTHTYAHAHTCSPVEAVGEE